MRLSASFRHATRVIFFLAALSARADSWTSWSQIHLSNLHAAGGTQIATDGTNFYYSTLANGIWAAPYTNPSAFSALPMTGFPLWDANTNTNGFAVINMAVPPQGGLVISGAPVNIVNLSINYEPSVALTNTLPVFYWWDTTNQIWHPASVTGKSYPYTANLGNFSIAPDGSLWTCSGFSPYAYRSTDGGQTYTASFIDAGVPSNYFPIPLTSETSFGKIFAIYAGAANQVVIGTETGGFLETTNNGLNWTSLDPDFTNANSLNPLGRIGNAAVLGQDCHGDFLCANVEFIGLFPGYNTWEGVPLIAWQPSTGAYFPATNGRPSNLGETKIVTPPSGASVTCFNQNYLLQGGIFQSSDGLDWTQFNQGTSFTNFPAGITNALEAAGSLTTLGNLIFIAIGSTIYSYDSTPPPVTNRPPVAEPQNVNLLENTATNFTLVGNDADGNALAFDIVLQPSNGTLSGAAPNLTYTPAQNFTGLDLLEFAVTNGKATSAPVAVHFSVNAPGNPAPAVYLTSPANLGWFVAPTNLAVSATANAPGGIQQVTFYSGTSPIGSVSNPPYSIIWTNPPTGDYALSACAVSSAGAQAWSQPVILTILPTVPALSIQGACAGNVTLSWPLPLSGFYVESATNIAGPWSLSPYPPTFQSGGQTVAIPSAAGEQFFSLMHPR